MPRVLLTGPGGGRGLLQFMERALIRLGAEVRSFDVNDFGEPTSLKKAAGSSTRIPVAGPRIGWRLERAQRRKFISSFNSKIECAIQDWRPDIWLAVLSWNDPIDREVLERSTNVYRIAWLMDDPFLRDGSLAGVLTAFDRLYAVDGSWVVPVRLLSGRPSSMLACGADMNLNHPVQFCDVPEPFRGDVSFLGTSYWGQPAGTLRRELLLEVADLGLSVFGDHNWLKAYRPGDTLGRCYRGNGELDSADTNLVYNGTKVNLNIHHPQWREGTSLRTFAIAASGAFQLVDYRYGLGELFALDEEIAAYESPGELREKVIYYLDHEDERNELAHRALERVQREHTYAHRISQILIEAGAQTSNETVALAGTAK